MFRQGLRRCATQASTMASASMVLRSRAALPTARHSMTAPRSIAPLTKFASMRLYSSEAAAAIEDGTAEVAAAGGITKFADLDKLDVHPNLIESITAGMGYETMTPVQAKTINPALKGTDLVAQAKTGTGKTLAFLLPLLQRMITEDPSLASRSASRQARSDDVRGIILSPTRELAEQIATEARRLVKNTGLVVQCAVGGTNKASMLRQTQREGCHLLVATPGRLNDLLQDSYSGIDAPNLAALVLDEADRMLDVGFEQELNQIISYLPKPEEKVRQTMLVSATIPDDVIRLARSMVRPDDFEFVQTIPENESLTHDRIPQHVVPLPSWSNVFPTLYEMIDKEVEKSKADPEARPFKALVYFNTTALVELAGELAFQRRREGWMKISTFAIHSKLSQMGRTRAAETFRSAKAAVLFSSDVTARGMDFPDVTHVIQVDAPRDRESYIHRLGRTGRQNKEGEGWLFLPPTGVDAARKMLRGLPLQQNKTLENASVDVENETELPRYYEEFRDLVGKTPKSMVGGAYTSLFGHTTDKNGLAADLEIWTTKGLGWKSPPAVSQGWASKMGINPTHLNIGRDAERSFDGDRRGGSRDRSWDSNFSGGGSRRGGGGDAFSRMSTDARRDDNGGGRFSGGGGRGFGGGRRDGGRREGGGGRDGGRDGGRSSW